MEGGEVKGGKGGSGKKEGRKVERGGQYFEEGELVWELVC